MIFDDNVSIRTCATPAETSCPCAVWTFSADCTNFSPVAYRESWLPPVDACRRGSSPRVLATIRSTSSPDFCSLDRPYRPRFFCPFLSPLTHCPFSSPWYQWPGLFLRKLRNLWERDTIFEALYVRWLGIQQPSSRNCPIVPCVQQNDHGCSHLGCQPETLLAEHCQRGPHPTGRGTC